MLEIIASITRAQLTSVLSELQGNLRRMLQQPFKQGASRQSCNSISVPMYPEVSCVCVAYSDRSFYTHLELIYLDLRTRHCGRPTQPHMMMRFALSSAPPALRYPLNGLVKSLIASSPTGGRHDLWMVSWQKWIEAKTRCLSNFASRRLMTSTTATAGNARRRRLAYQVSSLTRRYSHGQSTDTMQRNATCI